MKECTKCKELKDISEYHSDKSKKDGKSSSCKCCKNKQNKYRSLTEEYKVYKKTYDSKYRKTHKGKAIEKRANKKKREKYRSDVHYRESELHRLSVLRSKPEQKKKQKVRQQNIPNELRAKYNRDYRQRNRDKFNKWSREYFRNNKHIFAWRQILADTHKRMGTNKHNKTILELGYSANDLKIHLESLFLEGMSWCNHGEWHIDHIKPVSSFKKGTPASIVNELNNLQPLWAYDNLSKGGNKK